MIADPYTFAQYLVAEPSWRGRAVSGVAYEVRGLAELRPLPRATVEAVVTRARTVRRTTVRETVGRFNMTADAAGRFEIEIPIPDEPMPGARIEVTIRRANDVGRRWEYGIALRSPLRLELLTDRNLYESGESVHVWTRLTDTRGRRPVAGDRENGGQLATRAHRGRPHRLDEAGGMGWDGAHPPPARGSRWRIRAR